MLSAAGADDWILAPGQEYPTLASSGQVESSAQAIDHWLAKRRTLAFADLAIAQKRGAVPHCFPAQQLRQEMAKVIAINGVLRKWVHALCRLYRGITFGNSQLLADNRPIIIPHDQKLTHVWRFVEESGIAREEKSVDRPTRLERFRSWWGDLGRVRYGQVSFASLASVSALAVLLFYSVGSYRAERDKAVVEAGDALKMRDEANAKSKELAAQKTDLIGENRSMTAQVKELDAKLRQALRVGYWGTCTINGQYPEIENSQAPCSVAAFRDRQGKSCALVGASSGLFVVQHANNGYLVGKLLDSNRNPIDGDWSGLPIIKYRSTADNEARELDFFACKKNGADWVVQSVRLQDNNTASVKQVYTLNSQPFSIPSGANLVNLLNDNTQQHAFVLITQSASNSSMTILRVYGNCNHSEPEPKVYDWQTSSSNVAPLLNTGVAAVSRCKNKLRAVFVCFGGTKLVTTCIEMTDAQQDTVMDSNNVCNHKSWVMRPVDLGSAPSDVKYNVAYDDFSGDVVMYTTFKSGSESRRRMFRFNWKDGWDETVRWDAFVSEQAESSNATGTEAKWFFEQIHYPYAEAPPLLCSVENGGVVAVGADAAIPCRQLKLIPPERSVTWAWELTGKDRR